MSARTLLMAAAGAAVPPGVTLDLSFFGPPLDPRITFTRASTATYFDATGTMQTAASGAPRFDYDSATHAPRGLLIEEARTNLVLNGNTPTLTGVGATVAASVDIPPLFGAATVYKQTIISGAARSYLPISGLTAATKYIFSFWAYVPASNTTTQPSALYNNTGEGLTGTADYSLPNIYDMSRKGVWQRLVIGYTTGAAETSLNSMFVRGLLTGDVFYTTCYQVESGAFPTSYIPTTAAAVTRALEVCQIPTSPWFTPSTYSLSLELDLPVVNSHYGGICDTVIGNASWFTNSTWTRAGAGTPSSTPLTAGAINKTCGTMNVGVLMSICTNGGAIGSSASTGAAQTTATRLAIGNDPWSLTTAFNGHMRRVRYWPRVLSNAELQSVTR